MICTSCDNDMHALWTPDIEHAGSTAGWSPEFVCPDCTPGYYRKHR